MFCFTNSIQNEIIKSIWFINIKICPNIGKSLNNKQTKFHWIILFVFEIHAKFHMQFIFHHDDIRNQSSCHEIGRSICFNILITGLILRYQNNCPTTLYDGKSESNLQSNLYCPYNQRTIYSESIKWEVNTYFAYSHLSRFISIKKSKKLQFYLT
jgi:hypothetical protein